MKRSSIASTTTTSSAQSSIVSAVQAGYSGSRSRFYGQGRSDRGVSSISAITVRCIEIACHNPAARGECRVYNQFHGNSFFRPRTGAIWSRSAARKLGVVVEIDHIPDPRVEAEQHYYNAKHSKLVDLGLQTA